MAALSAKFKSTMLVRIHRILPHQTALLATACAFALAPTTMADEIQLMNGGKLTGNVISIHENGAIRMDSPLAIEPLSLVGEAVKKIDFHSTKSTQSHSNTRFELLNRDFLIGSLIDYSRETGARIHADGVGEIQLPPSSLRFMALDTRPMEVLYDGPDDLTNWTSIGRRGKQNWQFERNRLSATSNGQIGRMLELPERYVLRIKVRWEGIPNFQLGFSDPLEDSQERIDRYYLQFGRAGMEIKRESKSGKRYHTVGVLNRTPDQFNNREMEIELRVDLRESVIHLAINGQQEGRFMDPFGSPMAGGGISLTSNAGPSQKLDVLQLVVESWHEEFHKLPTPRQRPTEPLDLLMMRDGDSFGGELLSITPHDDGLRFRMKVGFRDEPIEILGEDVSMVGFAADAPDDSEPPINPGFVLQLQDRGRLSVTRSFFEAGEVRAAHPVLGDLTIPRNTVSSLQRHLPEEDPSAAK